VNDKLKALASCLPATHPGTAESGLLALVIFLRVIAATIPDNRLETGPVFNG